MIVIVTGGRHYRGAGLAQALDALDQECPRFALIVGDARGADTLALDWATRKSRAALVIAADWRTYGRAAGPKRNADLVGIAARLRRFGERVICLAAPGGRGTADCVRRCQQAGFEVQEVTS